MSWQPSSLRQASRSTATAITWCQARLIVQDFDVRWLRPVSLPVRMASSTRAWRGGGRRAVGSTGRGRCWSRSSRPCSGRGGIGWLLAGGELDAAHDHSYGRGPAGAGEPLGEQVGDLGDVAVAADRADGVLQPGHPAPGGEPADRGGHAGVDVEADGVLRGAVGGVVLPLALADQTRGSAGAVTGDQQPAPSIRSTTMPGWHTPPAKRASGSPAGSSAHTPSRSGKRAHAWFTSCGITVRRVIGDSGSAYKSHLWRDPHQRRYQGQEDPPVQAPDHRHD